MTVGQFYEQLLDEVAVDDATMKKARAKRDELGGLVVPAIRKGIGQGVAVRFFGAGALAQGSQIRPLNDVDVVIEAGDILPAWANDPARALRDIASWIEADIGGTYEIGTHAIKFTLPDLPFTADIVFGLTRTGGGLRIPHCPDGGTHCWIETDPEQHRQLVLARNRPHNRAVFSRQLRILKQFNTWCKVMDDQQRKPLASFHVTALALHILGPNFDGHGEWTAQFFREAKRLVHQPLPSPTGIGEQLRARDPGYAAEQLARAEDLVDLAQYSPSDAESILRKVFGEPRRLHQVAHQPVSVTGGGSFVPASSAAAAAAGSRAVKQVRSYGDDGQA